MSSTAQSPHRVPQIIVAALLVGVLIFAAVVAFSGQAAEPRALGDNPLDWVVAALVPLQLAASMLLPRAMVEAQIRRLAEAPTDVKTSKLLPALFNVFLTSTIVGGALAEAAAFLALLVLFMGGHPLFWGLVAAAIIAILVRFPTAASTRTWFETNTRKLMELRSLAKRT